MLLDCRGWACSGGAGFPSGTGGRYTCPRAPYVCAPALLPRRGAGGFPPRPSWTKTGRHNHFIGLPLLLLLYMLAQCMCVMMVGSFVLTLMMLLILALFPLVSRTILEIFSNLLWPRYHLLRFYRSHRQILLLLLLILGYRRSLPYFIPNMHLGNHYIFLGILITLRNVVGKC